MSSAKIPMYQVRTGLPREFFWLSFCGRRLKDDLLSGLSGLARDSSVQLVHRLLGGKGGFGALLRGAGRAALTDNFDACRDLNGRRLRHVNADKKLEDWAAEAKERQLEKIAMKHLREQERERNKAQKAQVIPWKVNSFIICCMCSSLHQVTCSICALSFPKAVHLSLCAVALAATGPLSMATDAV